MKRSTLVIITGMFFSFQLSAQTRIGTTTSNASAQLVKNSLYKQTSEMADIMIQYDADKASIMRFYSVASKQEERDYGYNSPERRKRLLSLIEDYQKQMQKLDFASMDINGKVDYILFKRNLEDQTYQLKEEQNKYDRIVKYIPFSDRIYTLEIPRRRGIAVEGQEVAKELSIIPINVH